MYFVINVKSLALKSHQNNSRFLTEILKTRKAWSDINMLS